MRWLGHAWTIDREFKRDSNIEQAVVASSTLQTQNPLALKALPHSFEIRLRICSVCQEFNRQRDAIERSEKFG
jgi:hypothetical protein